jgi:hypothetical protein
LVVLSPSEARKQFFHLGELAAKEPVLVPTSIPFIVTSVSGLAAGAPRAGRPARHIDFALMSRLGLKDIDFEIPAMSVTLQLPEP